MSYDIGFCLLRGTDLSRLPLAGGPATSLDLAMVQPDVAHAAALGDDVVVVDALYGELAGPTLRELGVPGVVVALGGTADVYTIEALGGPDRRRVQAAGAIEVDEGEPLPEEAVMAGHDDPEDAHLALVTRYLGRPVDELWAAEYVPLALPDPLDL